MCQISPMGTAAAALRAEDTAAMQNCLPDLLPAGNNAVAL